MTLSDIFSESVIGIVMNRTLAPHTLILINPYLDMAIASHSRHVAEKNPVRFGSY